MKQRVVQIVVMGSIMAAGLMSKEVYSDGEFFRQAEPSQHVMHIRKLTDSDNLRIELEPVWFHLKSTEQKAAGENQQVKRQARPNVRRPVKVLANTRDLDRHQNKNHHDLPTHRGVREESETTESFLKDFWQMDIPDDREESYAAAKKSNSLELRLENTDLPACIRRYLHEMSDRNNDSVRKLMRCLARHPEESCNEARRTERANRSHVDDRDDLNDPQRGLHARKVIRKRKFSEDREGSPEQSGEKEDLKFEKQFFRSDSDDGGQVFAPMTDLETEGESNESSERSNESSGTMERLDDVNTQDSDEPARKEQKYDHREPYRRPPQKYNTRQRCRSSAESEQDCSCESSDESCENC